ncbi:xanthine dehydrogenase family protein molybdopterin-binding subunit [Phytohabitans flavus]
MGTAVDRVDGPVKVTGAARYAADVAPPHLTHGYLVTSTVAAGTIRGIDLSAAGRSPGVIAIYTPDNPLRLNDQPPGLSTLLGEARPPLQDHEVRYHGQIIGLVVAASFEQARDAAALVTVDYDARTPNASFAGNHDRAVAPPPTGLPLGQPVDILADGVSSIDEALRASDVTLTGTYDLPPRHHNALEPHAAVAMWRDGQVTIHSATQGPSAHALEIAAALGVGPDAVRVVSPHVGGGFGGKAFTWAPTLLAAAAARELDRPVKVVTTREQLFTVTGHRSAVHQRLTLGARADGRLNAVKHDSISEAIVEDPGIRATLHFYATPNLHAGLRITAGMDLPRTTIMRAPGDETGSFALESAMDELAERLGMDPIDLRLANYLTHAHSADPAGRLPYSSKHLDECYRVGARRFGWHRRDPQPRAASDGDWFVGMGMATAVLGAARAEAAIRVHFHADGTASVATSTADLGTGMWTVLAVMGADSLGIPISRVRPAIGDSRLPVGAGNAIYGAIGSAATATVAPAVGAATRDAITALIHHAVTHRRSPLQGLDPGEVRYRHGTLTGGGRTVGFGELLTATRTDNLGATTASGPPATQPHTFASYAAHFCEVRVHRWTGETRMSRLTSAVDAGAIVNRKAARNQIIGGLVFGTGAALLEASHVEPATGRIANANLADYLLHVNADIPDIDVHFLDHPDTAFSAVGARGIGELGTIGAAAAVANAVYNATGTRIRALPITPDKLLQ